MKTVVALVGMACIVCCSEDYIGHLDFTAWENDIIYRQQELRKLGVELHDWCDSSTGYPSNAMCMYIDSINYLVSEVKTAQKEYLRYMVMNERPKRLESDEMFQQRKYDVLYENKLRSMQREHRSLRNAVILLNVPLRNRAGALDEMSDKLPQHVKVLTKDFAGQSVAIALLSSIMLETLDSISSLMLAKQ